MRGEAFAGQIVSIDRARDAVELRTDEHFHRGLPRRPERLTALGRLWRRLRPAPPDPPAFTPSVRTFQITPQPMATDAHTHPVFERLAGGLAIFEVKPGERVFVVQAIFVALLRDDPATRARVVAAWDRSADVAWAAAASSDALHLALVERKRWDMALNELEWRKAFDPRRFVSILPPDHLSGLQGMIGRLPPADRAAFIAAAAEHLARAADRAHLNAMVDSLKDHAGLDELEPLWLLVDGATPQGARLLEFARVRLEMMRRGSPERAAKLTRLASYLRV